MNGTKFVKIIVQKQLTESMSIEIDTDKIDRDLSQRDENNQGIMKLVQNSCEAVAIKGEKNE